MVELKFLWALFIWKLRWVFQVSVVYPSQLFCPKHFKEYFQVRRELVPEFLQHEVSKFLIETCDSLSYEIKWGQIELTLT